MRPKPATALPRSRRVDSGHLRRWLRKRGIRHHIARKGIESSTLICHRRLTE
ncbi:MULTISPECIES: hypothetical protein [unclassified Streptomyces]|uniref:hypothetical protein n=1 Tax=unclassified Streptomyces TaxID=2593676 RepID=UPI0037F7D92B